MLNVEDFPQKTQSITKCKNSAESSSPNCTYVKSLSKHTFHIWIETISPNIDIIVTASMSYGFIISKMSYGLFF